MKILNDNDFLNFKGKQESQFIVQLSERSDAIKQRFSEGVTHFGDELPWFKTHDKVRCRPGEVSLWCGINGHGKSLLLSHVMAHMMKTTTCLIASMEMTIESTGQRMVRQIAGMENPTDEYVDDIIGWTDSNLWLYDQLDTVQPERIISMCMYAMSKLNIKHIVIDSLMKCGVGTEPDREAAFIDKLCWAAKTYGGHIHLVHHVRKGVSEDEIPNKFDVKGSGTLTDMIDNLFIVHRNKKKERLVEAGEDVNELMPDATLTVEKQRHGEWEGRIALYFDEKSHQYLSAPHGKREWFGVAI